MRVLVFSQAAWNTTNSFGNTVTNWFEGWKDTKFYHFYARQQQPNVDIASEYYNVSAIEIFKGILKHKKSGRIISRDDMLKAEQTSKQNNEQARITKLHKKKNQFMYYGMEKVWLSKKWINCNFEKFVDDAAPDLIFAFATNSYILKPAIEFIEKKRPSVKVVLWLADDVLSEISNCSRFRRKYLKRTFDYCINRADKLYGASEEMCNFYSEQYGKTFTPLYKGCDFQKEVRKSKNTPLRFVYAGNLLYGRDDALIRVVSSLKEANETEVEAVLEIYSNTTLLEEKRKELIDNRSSFYLGTKPYEEIKNILNQADIVLHVESFEEEQIKKVRYSFSTKIIDCLQSGSAVVGIGPARIASIEYLRHVDGAIIIDSPETVGKKIKSIIHDADYLVERATETREFAMRNHDISVVRERLHYDFECLINN